MSEEIKIEMDLEQKVALLLRSGFKNTTYREQAGVFVTKAANIDDMKYAGDKMIDGDLIQQGMTAITELCPDGMVQLHIPDADYVENYHVNSDEGIALLNDAIPAAPLDTSINRIA